MGDVGMLPECVCLGGVRALSLSASAMVGVGMCEDRGWTDQVEYEVKMGCCLDM